jgi:iron complex outermembrane recepter protein
MFRKCLWSAAPMALLIGSGAHAQSATQSGAPRVAPSAASATASQVGEVVVTARKQVENVQSVPASVAVAGAARLTSESIVNFEDITKVLPAINISMSPDPNQFAATVRGLGTEPGNPSFDSSVATYIDGAFLSRDREFSASMFDMSSIETISGTQAALLGKNSSLGALNMVTAKPGEGYEVDARYFHEFQLDSDRIEGGFDVPVSSTLKFRLAGFFDSEGGPVQDVISGEKFRDQKGGARITVIWTPSERVDVTAIFQGTTDSNRGPTADAVLFGPAPGLIASNFGYPNVISNPFNKNAQFSSQLGYDQRGYLNTQLGNVTVNFHIGDGTLTSQTGYAGSQGGYDGNYAFIPGNALVSSQPPDNSEQFTQELRYSSTLGSRIDYVGGLFYLYSHYKVNDGESTDFPFGSTPLPFPFSGSENTYFKQTDEAESAFAQANFQIIDELKLVGGLRYTNERKSADFERTIVVPGIYSELLDPPVAPFSLSESEGHLDGSVGLNYTPTRNVLLYATWGQGTKAGGYAATVSDLQQSRYKPEVAQTAEVGVKSQFFDRTLTVNVDAFDTSVHNFQVVSFNGVAFVVANQNVRSEGVESQVSWAPALGFHLYWNNDYADAHDADTGGKVPYAPRWSGLVGGSYQHEVLGHLKADLDVNVDYRSDEISQPIISGQPAPLLPPLAGLHRLNLSVGLADPAQGWEVRLIGQNLTDQRAYGFSFPLPFVSSPAGTESFAQYPINPLTIKLQVSFKM